MTPEILKEQHEKLTFFNDDLTAKEVDWYAVKESPELMLSLANDFVYVNRMNTIGRYKELLSYTPFKANLLKSKLLDPETEANELGEVMGIGSKMTPELWDVYTQHYDEIFETTLIKENEPIA